jgi:hypothetical protein
MLSVEPDREASSFGVEASLPKTELSRLGLLPKREE